MLKIKSIKTIKNEDVYNMQVKDHHNFSVNGGLIVHNCDALRYFCNMIINPSAEPKKKKKELPFALRTDNEVKQNIVMEW